MTECVFYTLCWAVVNVGVTLGGGCQCPVFAARLNGFKRSETQTCSEKENKNLKWRLLIYLSVILKLWYIRFLYILYN